MPTRVEPLPQVVGQNCKAIRTRIGITQDQLARYGRSVGLKWTAAATANFEAGRSSPTLATLVAVSAALQQALDDTDKRAGWHVTLADLVAFDGGVTVNDLLSVSGDELAAWATGSPVHAPRQSSGPSIADITQAVGPTIADVLGPLSGSTKPPKRSMVEGVAGVLARAGVAEYRVAKRLKITPEVLAAASFLLWQRTFSEERDERAGPDANAQRRGQITRQLSDEISDRLKGMK